MAQADFNRINTNIGALNALNSLNNINRKLGIHQLRLATGKRINSAADDAAGWTIASKFKVRAEGLGVAINNVGNAKNLMAVAEGNLQKIMDLLGQMKAKTTQGADDALGSEERTAINNELNELALQVNEEVEKSTWNSMNLLSGSDTSFTFQVGAGASDTISFDTRGSDVGYTGGYTAASLQVDQGGGTIAIGTADTYYVAPDIYNLVSADSSATTNANLGTTLTEGYYSVQVTEVAANTSDTGTVTFRILDSDGAAVSLSSTAAGTGSLATSATVAVTQGTAALFDTGRGFKFQLDGLASGETGEFTFKFEKDGNNVTSATNAQSYMAEIDEAITNVNKALGYIGSRTNRMTVQEESLAISKVNHEAARSRILDADMAYEQFESTKLLILQQTATAMLAQANSSPQSILSLFR